MTVFQNYFDVLSYNIKVVATNKRRLQPKVVTLRTAARMAGVPIDELLEVMRKTQTFENAAVTIYFSHNDNKAP